MFPDFRKLHWLSCIPITASTLHEQERDRTGSCQEPGVAAVTLQCRQPVEMHDYQHAQVFLLGLHVQVDDFTVDTAGGQELRKQCMWLAFELMSADCRVSTRVLPCAGQLQPLPQGIILCGRHCHGVSHGCCMWAFADNHQCWC
jgi:hypothetical protein